MPMTIAAEAALATRRRAESNGMGFWHTAFIGGTRYRPDAAPPPGPETIYPVAFLVEQDPDMVAGAHFHQADQFQVVVRGGGRFGARDVSPIMVQFAAAFTAYGPIQAGADGLHYFTLRNGWDPGARYMPGARADLPRPRTHREVTGKLSMTAAAAEAPEPVLAPEPDGLAAWRWRIPAGARLDGPDPRGGRGQFWLVLKGTAERDGQAFGPHSCAFVRPDEPALAAVAGTGGLDVLAMQFPRRLQ